jgi:hypothetical protein
LNTMEGAEWGERRGEKGDLWFVRTMQGLGALSEEVERLRESVVAKRNAYWEVPSLERAIGERLDGLLARGRQARRNDWL